MAQQHAQDLLLSGGDPDKMALGDFTLAFNIHSFTEYFVHKYLPDFDPNTSIEKEVFIEHQQEWLEYFNEHIAELYQKGITVRKKLIEDKNKEPDSPNYVS